MAGIAQRLDALRRAWRNAALRRLCLAAAGFRLSELAVWIALIAYAYSVGGVREASALVVAQLVPATLFALAVGGLIRRHGAGPVLRWGLAFQSLGMLVAAIFLREGRDLAAYAGAIVASAALTTTRPAQSVMTPTMVAGADELTAANVFAGVLHSAAALAGPVVAAVIMTSFGSWAVLAVMAVVVAAAAAAVWRLPVARTSVEEDPDSLVEGLRAMAHEPGPRVMVLAIAAYYLVIGAFDVLAAVIAVELLGKSEAFTGYVTSAAGVGCVIAGSISLLVIGRRWLSPWILSSGFAIGGALVAVSIVGSQLVASMLALVAFGVAEATFELTSLMLLQRVSRLDLIGHVFSFVEALQMAMLAAGAAIVPLVVHWFDSDWAPAGVGVMFMLLIAALATQIVLIDRHARVPITEMAALRSTRLFGALPGPALETVAREARRIETAAGAAVVRQGELGDEYFVVVTGRLMVAKDGEDVGELGRGDGFGEIALIREVPRTATVRALTDAVLLAVDREPFLTAVTGHATTQDRASSIANSHLDPK
jgi:hypothetical protein